MRKSSIKKQLKKDISTASCSDFSAVMARCEQASPSPVSEAVLVSADGKGEVIRSRAWLRLTIALIVAFFAIYAVILFTQNSNDISPVREGGYVVIDINPSIKIYYDENDIVTGAQALNEDGSVLICDLDFTGKTPKEAVALIFDKCVRLGYFSSERDNNAILASATSKNGTRDEQMTSQFKSMFIDEFSKKNMPGVVITGVQSPTLTAEADLYGIDEQKYALILYYKSLGGELDESEYAKISITELYEKISEIEKKAKEDNIKETQANLNATKKKIFSSLSTSIEKIVTSLEACIAKADGDEMNEPPHGQGGEQENGREERPDSPPTSPDSMGRPQGARAISISTPPHGKERYEGFKSRFTTYIDDLRRAEEESDCKSAVDGILTILTEMRADESDEELIALIDKTIEEINALYKEFELACSELSSLSATPEEESSARLEHFKDAPSGGGVNVEEWQKQKESEIAKSWYEQKAIWDNERKNDLKNKNGKP